jgi:uncharacterized protein
MVAGPGEPVTATVTLMRSAAELAAAGWDEIAYGADLFAANAWLAVSRSDPDLDRMAFLGVVDADGRLAAGLPTIRMDAGDRDPGVLKAGRLLAAWATAVGIDVPAQDRLDAVTMPSLLCGGRQPGTTVLLARAGVPAAQTARHTTALVRAAVDRAAGLGLRSTAFLHVAPGNRLLRDALRAEGFAEFPTDTTYRLDLGGTGFDGYLAGLPRSHRQNVRRDLRLLERAGVALETRPLAGSDLDELAPLAARHGAKYGAEGDLAGRGAGLRALADRFGADAVVFTARIGGDLAGFSAFVAWKGHLYARVVGFDYDLQRTLPLYFSTSFYQPIRYAGPRGYRVIHYGQMSGGAKLRRGCTGILLYGYLRCLDAADHSVVRHICSARPTR